MLYTKGLTGGEGLSPLFLVAINRAGAATAFVTNNAPQSPQREERSIMEYSLPHYLLSNQSVDDRALNTTPFKTLYTDHEGMIYWPCTDAVSEFCARREDYWDQCPGSFYLGFSEFTDDTHEMRPKAWIRFFVVDDPELNEAQYVQPAETYATLIGYSAATDSGYYAYLKVTGGIVNSLYVHRYNSNLERINIEEVPVQAGLFDTTDFVYRY